LSRLAAKDEKATASLIAYLDNQDPHLKNAAISAIWDVKARGLKQSALDSQEATVIKSLLAALGSPVAFVREHAAIALGYFQVTDGTVSSTLTNVVMNDKDGEVAVSALGSLAEADEAFCLNATQFLNSTFADVRYRTVQLLLSPFRCRKQKDASGLQEKLDDLIGDDDSLIRDEIIDRSFSYDYYHDHFADDVASELSAAKKLLSNSNFAVRISGVNCLSSRNTSLSLLLRALHDVDPRVRREAAFALAEIRDVQAKPDLEAAFTDRDLRARSAARYALVEMSRSETYRLSETVRDNLKYLVKNGDSRTRRYAARLLYIRGDAADDRYVRERFDVRELY
jgi:HEAT repeat protein